MLCMFNFYDLISFGYFCFYSVEDMKHDATDVSLKQAKPCLALPDMLLIDLYVIFSWPEKQHSRFSF